MGEDPLVMSSVKRLKRKHNLTKEAGMKYLQIEHKETHWSIIEKLLLEELANSLSQKDSFDITNLFSLHNYIAELKTGGKTCITTKTLNYFRSKVLHLVSYNSVSQR